MRAKRTIENEKAALEEVIQQYLQFEKEASIKELSLAYTDIDFIFDNEKIRGSLLYDKILKGLQKAMETVLDLTYRLRNLSQCKSRRRQTEGVS